MKVDIILRTHDGGNVHAGERIVDTPKQELIIRCLRSLVDNIKDIRKDYDIGFTIMDDRSSEDTLRRIRETAPGAELVSIPEGKGGNGGSMKECYAKALSGDASLVYFCEDDWIYFPGALRTMLEAHKAFTKNTGGAPVTIGPEDCLWDYDPNRTPLTRILVEAGRHWRTSDHTTFTLLCTRWTLIHHWALFQKFTGYGDGHILEDNTINLMYAERPDKVWLFTPIPALAIHMTDHTTPVVDWKSLWESYKEQ